MGPLRQVRRSRHTMGGPAAPAEMNAPRVRTLNERIAEQEHWRQADAVRQGLQPNIDPDGGHLVGTEEGLRIYDIREQQRQTIEGRAALVTQRMTKRLVDGWWETSYVEESVQQFGDPPGRSSADDT
jgi:hypothetical protein